MLSTNQRLWALQLIKDYEDIIFQYRLKLRRPLIEITDSESFWGRWDPLYRKIELSQKLIENHSWDIVLATLKHEMAHQIVSEIFSSDDSSHGDIFQEACDLLGLEKEYRSASGDLPRTIVHWKEQQQFENSILTRIEKLFSLANSDNEHEASLAMKKAQELLSKHNISECPQQDYVYLIINSKKQKLHGYQSRIGSLLMNYYYVDVVLSELYDASSHQVHKTMEILGSKENVLIAEYVYHYLMATLESLWTSYKSKTGATRHHKRSYFLGLLSGFEKTLAKNQETEDAKLGTTSKALINANNKQLKQFVGQRFPRLQKKTSNRSRYDYGAYRSGQSEGRNITINKGVRQGSSIIKRLTGRST